MLDSLKRIVKQSLVILVVITLLGIFSQCKKEDGDKETPKIELISPVNCDSVWKGEFLHFEAKFTDNEELAKYAIDIVENFDHQSYGSSDQGCEQEPEKTPFNPYKYVSVNDIPPGQKEFTAKQDIIIPESVDTGDYLFIVHLQDKRGLKSFYSVSVKIVSNDPQ